MICNLCRQSLDQPVYVSAGNVSITSMLEVHPSKTIVYYCDHCRHLLTTQDFDLSTYYDKNYKILIDSDEEDQLYEIRGDAKLFRLEHQANTLLKKLPISEHSNVLDYGSAKGGTWKRVLTSRPDLHVHLFDVSESYIPFWRKFLTPDRWAVYTPPVEWNARFDLVTSFFALEHVADPCAMFTAIGRMLRPGGVLYCIVPNTYTNIADFVVVDHVNHFSPRSLRRLCANTGFQTLDIDSTSHNSALILTARYTGDSKADLPTDGDDRAVRDQVGAMATYWKSFGERVQEFERLHAGQPAAIYGSGFYGNFIASCLTDRAQIRCFVDRDPYRHDKRIWNTAIIPPEAMPKEVQVVYVGLNPARARGEIEKLTVWANRQLVYYYP